jgi:hypothetical protein
MVVGGIDHMNLYEVIFHGSYGKTDGDEDTIYLVRATDFQNALMTLLSNTSPENHGGNRFPRADYVHELGPDSSCTADEEGPQILRGPYIQCAYNFGWRAWRRKIEGSKKTDDWEEVKRVA